MNAPSVVNDKNRVGRFGHLQDHNGALVTIIERKTSFTVSMLVDDKSAKIVTAATITLLQPFETLYSPHHHGG